jgi:hypothetical protein
MLSYEYLWLVPELTPVHEAYELALFQELVTQIFDFSFSELALLRLEV